MTYEELIQLIDARIKANGEQRITGTILNEVLNAIAATAEDGLSGKQDTIADLTDIRSGAALGETAYQLPAGGIPKTDLAAAVQTSLDKADTALQSYTETDPVFEASPAHGITDNDIADWNGKQNALTFDNEPTKDSTNPVTSGGVYDAVNPATESAIPADGIEPNRLYDLGELAGDTTITFATPADNSVANVYWFKFSMPTPAVAVTIPAVTGWSDDEQPDYAEGMTYEITVVDGIAAFIETTTPQ